MFHIVGVAFDRIMQVDRHAQALQALPESLGAGLLVITGQHDAAHIEADGAERVDQAQHFLVIGDAQVIAQLALFDVARTDGDHDFHMLLQLQQHLELAVRLKAGKDA